MTLQKKKKEKRLIKKLIKFLRRKFTKEDTWTANKHTQKCLQLFVYREMKIKSILYHYGSEI